MSAVRRVLVGHWLAYAFAALGDFRDALARADEALATAVAADLPLPNLIARLAFARVHTVREDFAEAAPPAEEALATCRQWDIRAWLSSACWTLGVAYLGCGRTEDGVALLAEARHTEIEVRGTGSPLELYLGSQAALARGDLDAAERLATQAIDSGDKRHSPARKTVNLWTLGEVARRRNPPDTDKAEAHFLRAIAVARELGLRPDIARSHLGLGRLYTRARKRDAARCHLLATMELFREMGMESRLQQTMGELRAIEPS
jgi:tetratricopeptide (TPR) repeat protein